MTNFLCAKHILIFIFAFLFCACSVNQPQYVDSRDFVSFGLDNHDIGDIIKKQVDSLLKQKIIKNQSEAQILTIGAIDNESGESIDIEIIANELTRYLSNSEKFVVVNAGRDKKIEQILRDSRTMRENSEYNQYTTIEQGNLIAPSYALTGKITKKNRKILSDEIIEYVFSFTLTDLKLGAVRWVGNEQIAKKLPKQEVKNFSIVESNKAQSNTDSSAKSKADWLNADFSKNHFIFGFDLGLLGLSVMNIEAFNINLANKTHTMQSNDEAMSWPSFPLNVRIGYVRHINNWSIGINALYNVMYASFNDNELNTLKRSWNISNLDYSQRENTKVNAYALLQRVGGEFMVLYQNKDPKLIQSFGDTSIYLGISAYVDIGSKLRGKVSQTHENGIYKADFTRKINELYMGIKAGLIWYFYENMGMTCEANMSFPIGNGNSINPVLSWSAFGLQWRI